MREIELRTGGVAIVDDEDFDALNGLSWRRCPKGYVVRRRRVADGPGASLIHMHRQIVGPGDYQEIDHANGVKHDNRRGNLRPCTNRENQANNPKRATWRGRAQSSPYKGVTWNKRERQWIAQLFVDGRRVLHYRSHDEKDAARAYDRSAFDHFGQFALLNFPNHIRPETAHRPRVPIS